VKRRDVLALDLAALLAVVWWWNPLFRLAHARWRAILEERCDDRAIAAAGDDSRSYCSSLVRAARLAVDGSGPCATPAGAAGMGAHALEARLRRLLAAGFAPRPLAWSQFALLVALALALLPAIGRPALDSARARHLANHALRHHGHAPGHVHMAELHD
jgi:beta-lactamase regulating signal transducer with metallopeptidase domain